MKLEPRQRIEKEEKKRKPKAVKGSWHGSATNRTLDTDNAIWNTVASTVIHPVYLQSYPRERHHPQVYPHSQLRISPYPILYPSHRQHLHQITNKMTSAEYKLFESTSNISWQTGWASVLPKSPRMNEADRKWSIALQRRSTIHKRKRENSRAEKERKKAQVAEEEEECRCTSAIHCSASPIVRCNFEDYEVLEDGTTFN